MTNGITWEEFETIIARLQTTFNKGATVARDEKLPGKLSGRSRQIDVCIRTKVGTENVLIIVECKKHKRKADVKAVESFIGVMKDVGAQMGIMVSNEGFSRSAYKRAKDENISLYRYQDTKNDDWPNGLETSALLEVWELTPLMACYVLADGTEEAITTDEGMDCFDVRGGPKTGLGDVLRQMWNSLEPAERYERDWFVECPSSSPERPEIAKLRLGARAKFVRGLKKGRLHFEGLVNESEGQAKVAGWKMTFEGAITPWPAGNPLPPSKSLSLLVKSVFLQSQNPNAQKLHDLIYNGAFVISVAGKEVMHLPISDAPRENTIRKQKEKSDITHPEFSADITASTGEAQRHWGSNHPKVTIDAKFVSTFESEQIKAFFEKATPFKFEANDLHADTTSIFQQLQSEFEASTNETVSEPIIDGCVQISTGSGNKATFFQIDGRWTRTSKQLRFDGQLRQSPLQVRLHRDILPNGDLDPESPIHFSIDWGVWEGQPILSLPYFEDIRQFLHSTTFAVKCLANGNEIGRVEMAPSKIETVKEAQKAVDAIAQYRVAAKYLGVNPNFPFSNRLQSLPNDDAEVLAKLIEAGVHEQSLVGQTFCIEADSQPGVEAIIKKKKLRMEQPGQICAFDFFGTKILLCPVSYVFTDVELIAVKSLDNNRVELTFEGGIGSLWRIGYHRSDRGVP